MLKVQPYHEHMTRLMEGFMLSGQLRYEEICPSYRSVNVAGRCGWVALDSKEPRSAESLIREFRAEYPGRPKRASWEEGYGVDIAANALQRRAEKGKKRFENLISDALQFVDVNTKAQLQVHDSVSTEEWVTFKGISHLLFRPYDDHEIRVPLSTNSLPKIANCVSDRMLLLLDAPIDTACMETLRVLSNGLRQYNVKKRSDGYYHAEVGADWWRQLYMTCLEVYTLVSANPRGDGSIRIGDFILHVRE